MSKRLLTIDVSKSKSKSKEEDLLSIRLKEEDFVQVSFSKLVKESKYIRDKYKYSEAIEFLENEILEIKDRYNIDDEIIKIFIELIEREKINISIEDYKGIYILSEYFCIEKITKELNNIKDQEIFDDLNFTIQLLIDSITSTKETETKLNHQIENFIISRIDECIINPKFKELPISTIYRIYEESYGKYDHNLLFDFIFESTSTRFIMLKFIELDQLEENKIHELIKLIEEEDEPTKSLLIEHISFNLSFIKNILHKYDELFSINEDTKTELKQTKQELEQTKIKYNQKEEELNQTKQELEQIKIKYNQKDEELNQIKQELDQCKKEFDHIKDEFDQMKSENKQTIIVGGRDHCNQLVEKPNNKNKDGDPIIHPPFLLSFDNSSILSYSVYHQHSVVMMSDGSLKGIGYNKDGRISATLQKTVIKDFTDFSIKDGNGRHLSPVSAVCYGYGTLYMFSKSNDNERQLVLCDCEINGGNPVFLNIGNHHPVSLFGGRSNSAAICSEGEIIFINRNSIKKSPNSMITSVSLPDGEKASSVACCNDTIFVLSLNGRVFTSPIENENNVLKFTAVPELSDQEIVCLSGTHNHCLSVSKYGRVFGYGSNSSGKLGLDEEIESFPSFKEISSLEGYEIRSAYAGFGHSLFETHKGKILSCGWNGYGELLLSSDPGEDVYSPTETTITGRSTFCIAGGNLSLVFIGIQPPPNTPNMRIQQFK